jgi:hypothetical protein
VGGFRLVEAKYPALLFKQQLDAFVQKIFPMMRDNVKKNITPMLVRPSTSAPPSVCLQLGQSTTCVSVALPQCCVVSISHGVGTCASSPIALCLAAFLCCRASASTRPVVPTAEAQQQPCHGGPAQLRVQTQQPARRTRPGVTSWLCLTTCSPSSRVRAVS